MAYGASGALAGSGACLSFAFGRGLSWWMGDGLGGAAREQGLEVLRNLGQSRSGLGDNRARAQLAQPQPQPVSQSARSLASSKGGAAGGSDSSLPAALSSHLSAAMQTDGASLLQRVRCSASPRLLSVPAAHEATLHGLALDARGTRDGALPSGLAAAAAFLRNTLRRL